MAMTAEALYTITTLMHTSSNVAVNSHLSLVSFRAILRASRPRLKVVADSTERDGGREQSAVVSRPGGQDTTLADRGSLRSQRTVLHRPSRLTTAHCSRAPFHSAASRIASCLNTRPRSA